MVTTEQLHAFNERKANGWKEVFQKMYDALFYFTFRITQNREDAEDIVMDVFIKAFYSPSKFPSVTSLKSFLYVSARNAAFNFVKKGRSTEAQLEACKHILPADEELEDIIEIESHQDMLHEELKQAILKLPPQQQAIINLLYYENKSQREIAEMSDVSKQAIYNQHSTAKKNLKAHLAKILDRLGVLYIIVHLYLT